MPRLIEQLISTVGEIGWLADMAISFKSKCWATKALAMRVFEYLHYFKPCEAENANILEAPLTEAGRVLEKAKEMTLEASRIGWLEEVFDAQRMGRKFHDLEIEFQRVQIGIYSPNHQQI